ncbi:MAG: hypothetical protein OIN84_12410 [Candidatus Methanoperedens sp.]|uniref:hypothetical protein n=1 Tax=Candidatus Methanoperedens sp. BLZ2 TaxID=2035255 RepID=UPI000BE2F4C0|nr:hypothetical protein [Candidatus Methanoperedens sp. BLZ2]KAB2947522.1 MAG: hypothetical protein F9K14_03700 [Candidatus Methanoperedens sp.]MBZ0174382.1 hypothetical protein [Candidatus Methanoperedens nitroreducens]MCX9078764.1 hypothetical protein [Candidatus Methanoperedens sp.]
MKKMNKTLLAVVGFLTLLAIAASAHFQGYSAVDNMEIRYDGSTMYTTAQSLQSIYGMPLVKSI